MNEYHRDYDPRLRYARNREECRNPEPNRFYTGLINALGISLTMIGLFGWVVWRWTR